MNFYDVIFAQQKTKTDSKYFREISDAINVLAGTETTYTPAEMAPAIIDAIPTEEVTDDIVSVTDAAAYPAEGLEFAIEPVQDLHGYDKPWPAGGGKNLLKNIRSTTTIDGVTFTVYNDGSVLVNGTPTGESRVLFSVDTIDDATYQTVSGHGMEAGVSYKICGCPAGGGTNTYSLILHNAGMDNTNDVGNGADKTYNSASDKFNVCIRIQAGFTANNLLFKPMICLSIATNPDYAHFEPYSNICPISGWTGVNGERTGKNLLDDALFRAYASWSDTAIPYGDMLSNNSNRVYILPIKSGLTYTLSLGISATFFPSYLTLARANGKDTSEVVKRFTTDSLSTSSFTFTVYDGWIYYLRLGQTEAETSFNGQIAKIGFEQLELGNQATSYEPYQGTSISIAFPTEAGTVYGGNAKPILGKLVDGMATVTVDENTPILLGRTAQNGVYVVHYAANGIKNTSNEYCCISDKLKSSLNNGFFNYPETFCVANSKYSSAVPEVFAISTSKEIQTQEEYIEWLTNNGPIQVVYKLATPIEYDITPQQVQMLLGENNVWCDTGDTTLKYKVDLGRYIEKLKASPATSQLSLSRQAVSLDEEPITQEIKADVSEPKSAEVEEQEEQQQGGDAD